MRNAPGINGKEQHDKYGNHPFFEAAKPRRLCARRLYMNTPSPNSMKRDPGRGSAYLSFLKKRCRDFFFFCLLLGFYVAFLTFTGIGCPSCGK